MVGGGGWGRIILEHCDLITDSEAVSVDNIASSVNGGIWKWQNSEYNIVF